MASSAWIFAEITLVRASHCNYCTAKNTCVNVLGNKPLMNLNENKVKMLFSVLGLNMHSGSRLLVTNHSNFVTNPLFLSRDSKPRSEDCSWFGSTSRSVLVRLEGDGQLHRRGLLHVQLRQHCRKNGVFKIWWSYCPRSDKSFFFFVRYHL